MVFLVYVGIPQLCPPPFDHNVRSAHFTSQKVGCMIKEPPKQLFFLYSTFHDLPNKQKKTREKNIFQIF